MGAHFQSFPLSGSTRTHLPPSPPPLCPPSSSPPPLLPAQDAPRDENGDFANGWHWNMPYTVKRNLPDWYKKEVERYTY